MPSFACQKCKAPLKLDDSLQNLNPASFDLLVGSSPSAQETFPQRSAIPADRKELYENAQRSDGSGIQRQGSTAAWRGIGPGPAAKDAGPNQKPDMSFVVLTDSQVQQPHPSKERALSGEPRRPTRPRSTDLRDISGEKLEAHDKLFEILSSRSDIDHPICTECADMLLSSLQARLNASTKERDAFISHLKDLKTHAPSADEVSAAQSDYAAAKGAEEESFAELLRKESQKAALERELADLDDESRRLEQEEEQFWRERNTLHSQISSLQNERDALSAAYDHDEAQLERLRRTNVYNDTFCVGHDGNFGTINGLRLGRMPPPNHVEWAEINAAWGVAALLLVTVAEKLNFTFQGFRIRPMGSATRIEKFDTSGQQQNKAGAGTPTTAAAGKAKTALLELFSSGDLPIGKSIMHRRFNEAMVAFLACVEQLVDFVMATKPATSGWGQMYSIHRDQINGISIRLGQSSDEAWTAACKYLLTTCKLLLAYASHMEKGGG